MTGRSFKSFAEAAAAAKAIARERKVLVHVARRGSDYIVETNRPDAPRQAEPVSQRPAMPEAASAKPSTGRTVRLCIDCGLNIPPARVAAVPSVSRCLKCQSAFENTRDTHPRIEEGLAGTREGHKKMRGQQWGDMRNRSRGR